MQKISHKLLDGMFRQLRFYRFTKFRRLPFDHMLNECRGQVVFLLLSKLLGLNVLPEKLQKYRSQRKRILFEQDRNRW
ncbi:hypothetical protein WJ55_20970 [Burkholderia ubonensis]|nr:hypothetical protein WI78_31065 [Burkholderia ubonensis]KVG76112.1 hypothetical protein WJ34_05625 [Burkholderia ubonensis]KVH21396.1 hypothetical protein WJ37_15675 [Burkholderia ubonensis]KVH47650.1 hypothetical protein WJ38_18635 [Burkholderia ubonensis]KVH83018.1 hypothetical protein WJ43_21375 [Burkholderia ubonensis]